MRRPFKEQCLSKGMAGRRKKLKRKAMGDCLTWCIQSVLFITMLNTVASSYCDSDSGYTTITDGRGNPHHVYISVTRDGSVWLRQGVDHKSYDWTFSSEFKHKYQDMLLSRQAVDMLSTLNYTDTCVLTDLNFEIRMDSGWHPSYVKAFNTITKTNDILVFRHNKECYMNTTLRLTDDKQGLVCSGGISNACGARNLPKRDKPSSGVFLMFVTFDPEGADYVVCQRPRSRNSYTFTGSYYHVYTKLASCPALTDSRQLGYEAKLRPHVDRQTGEVLIPDPTQTALAPATIIGWHVFAKIISSQHEIYLQVWRPHAHRKDSYYLVGDTLFTPEELRFQEVPLSKKKFLSLSKYDVLGLYFPEGNPIPYSTVPCASPRQRYMFMKSADRVTRGQTLRFVRAGAGSDACRQYSFTAILANKSSSKQVDDWQCPNKLQTSDQQKRSEDTSRTISHSGEKSSGKKVTKNTFNKAQPIEGDMAVPVNYILLIIGGLLLFMVIVGSFSYYRAIKS